MESCDTEVRKHWFHFLMCFFNINVYLCKLSLDFKCVAVKLGHKEASKCT